VAGIGHRVIRVRVSRRVTHRLLPAHPTSRADADA
jgi:hypothetical protein